MELTPAVVEARAREYPEVQPLSAVEDEHLEMLPETFANGDYGWRTAEWVVQWYFRRFLGGYPDRERRETEAAYGENDYEDVQGAITAAVTAEGAAEKLRPLLELSGVDVPVASAFLHFAHPEDYLVLGEREWDVLYRAGELAAPSPDPPDVEAYERYLGACRDVARRCDCDLVTLYRALWVLGEDG